ncbi:exodeoxyribonuclease V subunit gamma [Vibrio albus]|uniref:RecBCD enzyme subunit RecC n=1 Tax=Vibrio albus TaxID=2200953 RepID=A0A2U3BEJ4_9VIBR|nr:exodeoxyribonuclease V subunit gamma [Vibrio albus]PWI35207.1 exodeoxyribonuclease V subunit gamma [Vibrio albus]
MFTVYHSNQIDILKTLLVELIRARPLDNPFCKEQILVQSPGMSQWLKMELANELGVAANIEFPLPATFIWNMFVHVLDEVPERSAFNKDAMTWKLAQLIPEQLDKVEFSPLKQYLAEDRDGSKRYQLAEKIADIFDGYLVYRPEWIARWEAGESVPELGDEQPWQPILWQALYEHTLALGQSPYHRANLYEHFIDTLDHYVGRIAGLPDRLFVFGISSLPPRYMDALKALGQHMDVHLMFTNPCRYYWGEVRDRKYLAGLSSRSRQHLEWQADHYEPDGETGQLKGTVDDNLRDDLHTDVVGNSLLASMGKLGRDNLYLLSQLDANEIEAFADIDRDNLLHHIQADILNLDERQDDQQLESSTHKAAVDIDHSLSFHACHSPMREVEVLHDQLLSMFDADPELKPRDIIVMVADINAYSPAIQAVFGNAPGERYIPYSISDRTAAQESPVLNAFMNLVSLPDSRCAASELLELLETPEVMSRFGLDESEFERAGVWIEEAGIRWGIDAQTAQDFALPDYEQNTWLFGVQRMLLGYAMAETDGEGSDCLFSGPGGDIAPYSEVQGMDAELAGKLARFVERIGYYRRVLAVPLSAGEWREQLFSMLEDCFSPELDSEVVLKSIRDVLSQLQDQLEDAAFAELISPAVMQQYLENRLSGSRISQRFLAGQVNFCTLMPMRSIPFKTVCLLGMNDGAYPRSMPPEGFDLINGRTRPGDRSRRDDDRYLFLEALLSAQQTLYISYIARSIQDNSEKVPSILVTELLDYCGQNFCLLGDEALPADDSADRLIRALTSQHPMVPFSPSAFSGKHPSYAQEWLPVVNKQGQKRTSFIQPLDDILLDAVYPLELPLAELQRFWRLPVQYFFNRRLKVFFSDISRGTDDDEPFALDNLQGYQLREQLIAVMLQARLAGESEEDVTQGFIRRQRAKGLLPVGAFGELEFAESKAQSSAIVDELAFICQSPLPDAEVNIRLAPFGEGKPVILSGWLTNRYQAGLIRYRSGRIRPQDLLSAWIDHLCLAVSGYNQRTHLVGYDKKEGVEHRVFPLIDTSSAETILTDLIRTYYGGLNSPLVFFPRSLMAGAEAGSKGKALDDIHLAMQKQFEDGYNFTGEGANSYIARVWPEWSESLAQKLWENAGFLLSAVAHSEDNLEAEG